MEKKRLEYWVDGFDEITWTIYEFHGCYYHSCPVCFEEGFYNGSVVSKMGILCFVGVAILKRMDIWLSKCGNVNF